MPEKVRVRIGKAQARAIDPRQERRLEMRHFDTGQARDRGLKQLAVAAQIVEQGIEPWLAVAIRGERSLIAEQIRVVHRLLQVKREGLAQSDILDAVSYTHLRAH